jgi:putative transposase
VPGRVETVLAASSSQWRNACGQVTAGSRESQARFACGHVAPADVNAARSIADGNPAAGRAVAAGGDPVRSARSVKREPQRDRPPKIA